MVTVFLCIPRLCMLLLEVDPTHSLPHGVTFPWVLFCLQEYILSQEPVGTMTPDQWANHVFEKSREIEPKEQPVKKSVSCNSNSMITWTHTFTHAHTLKHTYTHQHVHTFCFFDVSRLVKKLVKRAWYPLLLHALNFP